MIGTGTSPYRELLGSTLFLPDRHGATHFQLICLNSFPEPE